MTQAAKAQEPSMEEILASIRRIIADDDAAKAPPKAAEPAKPAPAPTPPPKAAAPAPAAPRPAPAPPPKAPAPRPAPPPPAPAVNKQDDIDAMFAAADPDPEPEPEPEPSEAPSADILDLTEAMEALPEPQPAPALRRIDAMPDVVEAPAPLPPPPAPAPPPPALPTVEQARRQFQEKTEPDRQLLSASTTAAVDSAFNSLAQTVLIRNDLTLDGMVREMLRPMLKAWLDDNLPNMVERLVRAEIERVSRGRSSG